MASTIHTRQHTYERVELPEREYQDLLAVLSPRLFPGYRWLEFTPPVESPYGTAHPDAALLSQAGDTWWVVEVELARHNLRDHVDSQLHKLRAGWYGRQHFEYLEKRHPDVGPLLANLVPTRPQFLVVVDDRSTLIERAAHDHEFEVLHILSYRSADESGPTLFATGVEGRNPFHPPRRRSGVAVRLEASSGVTRLTVPADGEALTIDPGHVLVGPRVVRAWVESDGAGLVLALAPEELCDLIGKASYYLLSVDPTEPCRVTSID